MHLRLYTKLVTAACGRADTLTRHVCMCFSQMGTWWGPKNPTFWRHCFKLVRSPLTVLLRTKVLIQFSFYEVIPSSLQIRNSVLSTKNIFTDTRRFGYLQSFKLYILQLSIFGVLFPTQIIYTVTNLKILKRSYEFQVPRLDQFPKGLFREIFRFYQQIKTK